MAKPDDKKRIEYAQKAYEEIQGDVRKLQEDAYRGLLDWFIDSMEIEGGRVTLSAGNFSRVSGVRRFFEAFGRVFKGTLLSGILDRAGRLFSLNTDYFSGFEEVSDSLADQARLETLLRWGYDPKKGNLIVGGYLDAIFENNDIAKRVGALVNRAIATRMPLTQFRQVFRGIFVGKPGAGLMEHHFNRAAFDLFQRLDRQANLIYADKLGLSWAIYSGTVIETTRPFCEARNNKIFNRQQIAGWADLEFQGKPPIYDPFTDCGGYNCRHHLSFVSDEIAKGLRK